MFVARAVVVVFALLALSSSSVRGAESDVVVLNAGNFEAHVQRQDALVEFFAPWCGHCKKLAPEYADAAGTLAAAGMAGRLATVDCTTGDNKALCGKYDVKGFPTLKWFSSRGSVNDAYNGPRVAAGLVKFVKKKLGVTAIDVAASDDAVAELARTKSTVVAFVGARAGDEANEDAKLLAGKLSDSVAVVRCPACSGDDGVAVHVDGKVKRAPLDAAAADWLAKAIVPVLGDFEGATYKSLIATRRFVVFVLCADTPCSAADSAPVLPHAERGVDGVGFLRMSKQQGARVAGQLGFTGSFPNVIAVHRPEGAREQLFVKSDDEYTVDTVGDWLRRLVAGDVPRNIKSESAPTDNAPGKVWKVVANTIDADVTNADADVFLKIYAPWCGHCKAMAADWVKLAEQFTDRPGVRIAELDGTTNDHDFASSGYPTLYWVPKGGKPVQYNGARTYDALKAYVTANSKAVAATETKQEL